MADITAFRQNVQNEDVQFRSSVSEAVGGKIGGSINFVNNFQYDSKNFFVNGPYSIISGTQTGIDGAYICACNMEIYAIMMFNLVAGSSGTLQFDVKRFTASGGSGTSIFTTKPAIPSSSGNNAYLGYRFSDSTTLEQVSGSTLPVLTSVNLDAGDMITCDITSKQSGGQNGGLVIMMRPRN